jgi:hypothetical protein
MWSPGLSTRQMHSFRWRLRDLPIVVCTHLFAHGFAPLSNERVFDFARLLVDTAGKEARPLGAIDHLVPGAHRGKVELDNVRVDIVPHFCKTESVATNTNSSLRIKQACTKTRNSTA